MDIIEESVELAMLQFIDQPISNALIDAILARARKILHAAAEKKLVALLRKVKKILVLGGEFANINAANFIDQELRAIAAEKK